MAPELVTLATALKSVNRANSGLTWIQRKHVNAKGTSISPTYT